MNLQSAIITTALSAALILSACGGKSNKKIDATDGVTLDGTFQEAIIGFEKADQIKAAAGLLIFAYEGASEDNDKIPLDYVNEAIEEAHFLIDKESGNIFQSRGSALNDIAQESNGVLNGKTAQDLIDHYNIRTEQYDEYLEDQREAEAAKKEQEAAAAEAARLQFIEKRRGELQEMQTGLADAATANKEKREALKQAWDDASADLSALKKRQKAMTRNVIPSRTLSRSSRGFSGQVTIIIVNTADHSIMNPKVQIEAIPKGQSSKRIRSKPVGLYKFEEKRKSIASGAESTPQTFPINLRFGQDSPLFQGDKKDFSNVDFQAYLVGYEKEDGTTVRLTFDPKKQSILDNYEKSVGRCDAADNSIKDAKVNIPKALESLNAPNADPKKMPKLAATRC